MIGCRGDEAGVEGLHPHRFRRTFAHRWLAAGSQEQDLMRLKLAALAELYESRLRSDIDRAFQAQVALSIRCAGARCGGALLARVYRTSAAPVIVPVVAGLSRPFRDAQAARLKAAGLNLDEIGARLGVSRATAHRMVRRALREYVARPHDEADSSPSGARPARPAGLAGARRPAVRGQRPVEW